MSDFLPLFSTMKVLNVRFFPPFSSPFSTTVFMKVTVLVQK